MVSFCYDCARTQGITVGIREGNNTMSGHPNTVQVLRDLRGAEESLQSVGDTPPSDTSHFNGGEEQFFGGEGGQNCQI